MRISDWSSDVCSSDLDYWDLALARLASSLWIWMICFRFSMPSSVRATCHALTYGDLPAAVDLLLELSSSATWQPTARSSIRVVARVATLNLPGTDRKSKRLNTSH